ncbi:MAG TPA: hypothetical protein PK322_09600 [Opitutaceae bacterium]|mgnify:CR=1 FL=1|nr:hypothetical protein [Opitutaceae bacterium]
MNTEEELQVRREVRAAVFRTERLRAAGRLPEAREELEGELAAAQARLASLGFADAATAVLRWRAEDEGAFALATLLCELLAQRPPPAAPPTAPRADAPPAPALAFPPPTTDTPVLADLLDAMLAQERRPRPPPS